MRYFRSAPVTYEDINTQLDAAYGYPNVATKTLRTLPPADAQPVDAEGRVYIAVSEEYCNYILPSQLLAELLASGQVEEVTEETFRALLTTP